MSRPDISAANRLRGSSKLSSSDKVSRNASVRSSTRMSATCAIVVRSTRAATGWRSAWYVSRRLSGDVCLTTCASFQPRFTASCTPVLRPCPPTGECTCAASPASRTRPVAVGRGLPRRVGEPGDQSGTVDPVVGPVDGDETLAEIAQRGLARADLGLGQHDPDRSPFLVDHLAVLDLVLDLAQGMRARGRAADAQLRLLGHLDLGEQAARRRIPAGELDAGCLADQAASSVAPDEILRPQRPAVGQLDVDAGVVLREAGHLVAVVDRDLSSPTQPARMRSMWFCHSPSPYGWRVGKSLMSRRTLPNPAT